MKTNPFPSSLCLVLLIVSAPARAEWIEVERFADGLRVFANPASVKQNGSVAELMHLVRWAEPQIDDDLPPYRSTRVRAAYDCEARREKYLGSVSYAGTMGNGDVVTADDAEAESWYSISDASLEEKLWTMACAAK